MMIGEFQRILDRHAAQHTDKVAWIPQVLIYYRQLETLALSPNPSTEESRRLAQEASDYVREHRLKGVRVGMLARRLAEILSTRDAAD